MIYIIFIVRKINMAGLLVMKYSRCGFGFGVNVADRRLIQNLCICFSLNCIRCCGCFANGFHFHVRYYGGGEISSWGAGMERYFGRRIGRKSYR